jgi:hypothetical protein
VRKNPHSPREETGLRPSRPAALMTKERGVWVYQGTPTRASIPDVIDRAREKRLRELTG